MSATCTMAAHTSSNSEVANDGAASRHPFDDSSRTARGLRLALQPNPSSYAEGWIPGAGCASSLNGKDAIKAQQLQNCSQLFAELQNQVKAAITQKRKRDETERAESLRVALAHPLIPVEEVVEEVKKPKVAHVEALPVATKPSIRMLPLPLTEKVLMCAYKELQPGAAFAVKSCVECWSKKTLSDSDLLSTVGALASSSPSLAIAFKKDKTQFASEVASAEDMAALAQLSRDSSFIFPVQQIRAAKTA